MLLIDNKNITDPFLNLALEEYAIRNLPPESDYFLLYINRPSIVIGRHQNIYEEVNLDIVKENSLPLLRRISGGGTVYHDTGNLNFSFITRYQKSHFNNYKYFTAPIIAALHGLNINARLNGRNDIVIGDRKISGNAQFTSRGKMFSHGTLLFNSDLHNLSEALRVDNKNIESRSVKSVRSRVTNIYNHLPRKMDIWEFKEILLQSIVKTTGQIPIHNFSEPEWKRIRQLAADKYHSWEWTFAESPKFTVRNYGKLTDGKIELELTVVKGLVQNMILKADFLSPGQINEVCGRFIGIPYRRKNLSEAFKKIDLYNFFRDIDHQEIVKLFRLF